LLSFFRVNARYQTIGLVIFFLLLRLPFFLGEVPLLTPELSWMLVGEQMSRGFMLYRDVWDNVSPLSGLTYWLIDSLFGRAQWAYQFSALSVAVIQILYFNYVIYSGEVFPERNFIPGALYALFLNISFDLGTLSPMLMANTFLLFAFGSIVKMLVRREVTTQVFEMGLYIGIAALFYLPVSLFMMWAFLALLFYTGSTIRHHLLGAFGSLFPLMMVVLFFYLNNGVESLNRNLLTSVFQVKQYVLNDFSSLIASLLLPLGFGVMGFMRIFTTLRFVNYQTRIQQVMALWFIVAVFTIPLMEYLAPMQFIIFIPPASYFATHYFQSFKKKSWADELQFMLMGATILFIQYQGLKGIIPGISMGRLENLRAKPTSLPEPIREKRILVLGYNGGEYRENFTATPYLNWNLASYDLMNLDNYDSVIHVYDNFRKDPPDYVIDKVNIMPKLLARVPALQKQYELSPWKGIYQKTGI
jgi:hypothetical protein